jgi:signal transduction histidine kinase
MDAIVREDVTLDAVAVLDTLPLAIAVLHRDGTLCYANAPTRRLATVVHSVPAIGLARLTANPPARRDAQGGDCVDRLECEGEDGNPLTVVRQWRGCGDAGLQSVTLRPARGVEGGGFTRDPAAGVGPVAGAHSMLHADRLATVGQLAAGMAHEINNPICYVQSNLGTFRDYANKLFGLLELADELLGDTHLDAGDRRRAFDTRKQAVDYAGIGQDLPALLEESAEGVERIRHIVQSLRDFSRGDPGDAFQLYDVRRILDSTLDIVRSLSGRCLQCSTHYEPMPLIECNPTQLNQLCLNILVNASQAIAADGHIEIRARPADAAHVQIEISDDGCGMDEHALSHVFEPFFTTKGVGKGTGLGLSIGYGIVKKHAGDITVQSAPGQGTTFTITLPTRHPQPTD